MRMKNSRLKPAEFGRCLARARAAAGLTQYRLAIVLGCHPSLVSAVETGRVATLGESYLDALQAALPAEDWVELWRSCRSAALNVAAREITPAERVSGYPLETCANGCGVHPVPPSLVICGACQGRITRKLESLAGGDGWPKDDEVTP